MKKRSIFMALGFLLSLVALLLTMVMIRHQMKENQKMEVQQNTRDASTALTFPDTRKNMYWVEEDIEGAFVYEIEEPESRYHVRVDNMEVLSRVYNDYANCIMLPYYLHTYMNLCTGDLEKQHIATVLEDTVVLNEPILSFKATIDTYSDVIFDIEYDTLRQVYGISSSLGDYSLEALTESMDEKKMDGFREPDIPFSQDTLVEME